MPRIPALPDRKLARPRRGNTPRDPRFCGDAERAFDCSIVEMVVENGVPLSVGRKTRNIPIAILRALEHRDGRCTFPGCCNKAYLDAHHIKHWRENGETALENLVLLCHHTFVHEHGYTVVMGEDQKPQFYDPRGRLVKTVPPRSLPSTRSSNNSASSRSRRIPTGANGMATVSTTRRQ